jgi:SPP1 gp7 family putative phage head morphogenesis protein
MAFRDGLTKIALDGVANGSGYKTILKDVKTLLRGAADPGGITRSTGLERRAELIARSELSNAYVEAQRRYAQAGGYRYVRVIAVGDERICLTCGGRSTRIFRVEEITVGFHPRCRCALAAVPNEAVEEQDPELRRQLLDDEFWEQQREEGRKVLAEANGWDLGQVEAKIRANLQKPTSSERRLYPDLKRSAQAVDFPGPGGSARPAIPASPRPSQPSLSGVDGIGPKSKYMTKGRPTPTTDPSTWDRKTIADILADAKGLDSDGKTALRKQVANYSAIGLSKFLEQEGYTLDYVYRRNAFVKDGRSWQIGFEQTFGPRLTPEGLNKWVQNADPKVKADSVANPRAKVKRNLIDAPAINGLLSDIEANGGNVAASRAMAKMMREQDLLIAWGQSGAKNWDELLADKRAQEWAQIVPGKGSKGKPIIPSGNSLGHTSHWSRVVGMTQADAYGAISDATNLDAKILKYVIDDSLDRMIELKKSGTYQSKVWSSYGSSKEALQNGYVRRKADGLLEKVQPSQDDIAKHVANHDATVLTHELGHQMQWWLDQRGIPGGARTYGVRYGGNIGRVTLPGGEKLLGSKYSQTNVYEQFAEDWTYYLISPDKFRELKPQSAKMLDRLIESVFDLDNPGP